MHRRFVSSAASYHLSRRDAIVNLFTATSRLSVANATASANEGLRRFRVTCPFTAQLYARCIVAASLMASSLEGEERISLQFSAPSAATGISRLYAESMAVGEVRGYVNYSASGGSSDAKSRHHLPLESTLCVRRVRYNERVPFESTVSCEEGGGDIVGDVVHYFTASEQIPTALYVETPLAPALTAEGGANGRGYLQVSFAGGILAQRIAEGGGKAVASPVADAQQRESPVASWESIQDALSSQWRIVKSKEEQLVAYHHGETPHHSAGKLNPSIIDEKLDPSFILANAFFKKASVHDMARFWFLSESAHASSATAAAGAELVEETTSPLASSSSSPMRRTPLDFFCRCSKASYIEHLHRMGQEQVDTLFQQPPPGGRVESNLAQGSREGGVPLTVQTTTTPPPLTLTCQFCNNSYDVTQEEVRARGNTEVK